MKILFVSAVLPYPLHSGGQIRMYHLLKRLSQKHEITLVSFIRNKQEQAYADHLSFCTSVHMVSRGSAWQARYIASALFGTYPFLLATYRNRQMGQTLQTLLHKPFDIIHLEPFYVWPSIPKTTLPVVVSEHNIESQVYRAYAMQPKRWLLRPFLFLDILKIQHWERRIWKKAATVTAVSSKDAAVIANVTHTNVPVVANGVDLLQFPFSSRSVGKKEKVLLFVGDFKWFPNRDAVTRLVKHIWPTIKKTHPEAQLRVVGRHFSAALKQQIIRAGGNVGENVSDIADEYRSADIMIAPHAIAGGTKFKMLEAFASGLAVVTTPQGVSGIGVRAGSEYLEATDAKGFVLQVDRLWDDHVLEKKLVTRARQFVEKNFSWDSIAHSLDLIWKETYKNNT